MNDYNNVGPKFLFVVDTDQYAGNFERETCAYMTGQVGQCEVGDDLAAIFIAEVGNDLSDEFAEIVGHYPDHNGCRRPASIHDTNGYNSFSIAFDERPTSEMITLMKERAVKYGKMPRDEEQMKYKSCFEVLGCRLIERQVTLTATETAV